MAFLAFFALAAAGLILSPATPPNLGTPEAFAQASASESAAPDLAADAQKTTSQSPQGVSPKDPSIEPPATDEWVCPKCGAVNPCPRGEYGQRKHRHGGPMLAPGEPGGKGVRGGRGVRAQRGQARYGRHSGRGIHRGHGIMGHGDGVAAERMLRHAPELKLTDDQIGKLEMLAYETKKRMIGLRADIEREQLEVHKQMRSGSEDLTQIKRHLSAISSARVGIQEAKIDNLFKARRILTEEQKAMVKENHPRLGRILD
jgi:Spy/CpxP family protein refolding chaperone